MKKGVAVLLENETSPEPTYLMLEQSNSSHGNYYAPPSGHIEEKDQSPVHTATREVYEETGIEIDIEDVEKLGEEDADYAVEKLLWYRTAITPDEHSIELNHESTGYRFISRAEALEKNNEIDILESTRKVLQAL